MWCVVGLRAVCRRDHFCEERVDIMEENIPNELARPNCCDLGFLAYTVDGQEGCTMCSSECMTSCDIYDQ